MTDATDLIEANNTVQCSRCFGRGYLPEQRKPSKRNPHALGFYARTCPRCDGTGRMKEKPT